MKCKECKIINELFDSYVIYDTNNKRIIYCPNCNNVFETKQKNDYVRCILCKSSFNVNPKITDQGFFNCINCGFREKIVNSIKRNRKLLNSKIIAIEFECDICGRGFKTPTKIDQDNYLKAEKILEKNKKLLLFPKQKISKR